MSETPVTIPLTNSRYIAFFDECADRSLAKINPQFPLFVLALVVVERAAYRDIILSEMSRFKLRYWLGGGIQEVELHFNPPAKTQEYCRHPDSRYVCLPLRTPYTESSETQCSIRHRTGENLQQRGCDRMDSVSMKTKTGAPRAFSGNACRSSILVPVQTITEMAVGCEAEMVTFGSESDHPGYSFERAPWALFTGVGPLNQCTPNACRPSILSPGRSITQAVGFAIPVDREIREIRE